ncbi:hypothetical protein EW146_g7899 [Bondarzewia mesenterica]|uniref:Peptidase A1 domain-containing protein n=1 Tax=Bondarzewia mesenterica TaxID=1095465 RepID=A0A4S4LJ77_9AGAM|nr:hypothetical protein EW146_g7899 [Bondarzewia mesenterica]
MRPLESLPLALALLISASDTLARAAPRAPRELHVPLVRRAPAQRTAEEWGLWAKEQKNVLEVKYGGAQTQKRASGMNLIVNQNADSSYYGSIAIGTPATAYNVILDTGSSDLWLADSACTAGCNQITTFNPDSSSSFNNLTTAFSIKYGSGEASGVLGTDTVQMAGFQVNQQVFGVCSVVSSGLLTNPVSGLLGLAWQAISSSGATPFWQNLYEKNAWDQPVMAFQLTRFQNLTNVAALEPGGTFTMGNVNTSLYTGNIDYQNIPISTPTYWTLPLTNITVGSSSVTLPSGSSSYAAIDTGTTLVGGPAAQIAALFNLIPNSVAGTGNYEGYYIYRAWFPPAGKFVY